MKKLLLCAMALTLSATTLFGQNKGDLYVGGMIGVATSSISIEGASATQTTFSLTPEVGYFVCDNLRLAGSLGYQLSSSNGLTTHALTIGPSLAYYVRLCDRFYYTPELAVGFAFASTEGATGYGVGLGLALGAFEFQPSSRWGISLSLVSLNYSYISSSGIGISGVDFQLGIKPSIGLKYYF